MTLKLDILLFLAPAIFITLMSTACTKKTDTSESAPSQSTPVLTKEQLIEKGQKIYQMNCLSCHGPNPKIDGPIGPSIAGSPLELVTSRVMELKYPEGYKPKRTTSTMVALPHLKNDIPAIYEYLNSEK